MLLAGTSETCRLRGSGPITFGHRNSSYAGLEPRPRSLVSNVAVGKESKTAQARETNANTGELINHVGSLTNSPLPLHHLDIDSSNHLDGFMTSFKNAVRGLDRKPYS